MIALNDFENIDLDFLLNNECLSVRSYNVCQKHNLIYLDRILKFYLENESFVSLQNAGRKTELELTALCQKYLSNDQIIAYKEEQAVDKSIIRTTLQNLSSNQLTVINQFILYEFRKLSNRAQNALIDYFNNQVDISTLHFFFKPNTESIQKIRNVGKKTVEELIEFIDKIETFTSNTLSISDEIIESQYFINLLVDNFNLEIDAIELFKTDVLNQQFPVFKFLKYLIADDRLINKRDNTILINRSGYFKGHKILQLEEIAEMLGITRERVRQIAVNIDDRLKPKLSFFSQYKKDILKYTHYAFDFEKDLIIINNKTESYINESEGTSFTKKFITIILGYIHHDTHTTVGDDFDFFNDFYFIKNEILSVFNLKSFIEALDEQTNEKIEEDFILDFDGYLYSFFHKSDFSLFPNIRSTCEEIILNEFAESIELNLQGEIIFKRNSRIVSYELILEILKEQGKPMKVNEITEALNIKYPNIDKNKDSVRSHMNKEKDIFIYFGRSSTYGLLEWEKENEYIKGGTIRDIAEEYLNQFDEPKHISEIAEYVLKYRPNTTVTSINSNLQADQSERFKEFNGNHWGLNRKTYQELNYKKNPKFFPLYAKNIIESFKDADYEAVINILSEKYALTKIQTEHLIDKNIKDGIFRRENQKIYVC